MKSRFAVWKEAICASPHTSEWGDICTELDDAKFIWGWFPAKALAPDHVCFYLRQKSLFTADRNAVEALRRHLNCIRDDTATTCIWPEGAETGTKEINKNHAD